MLGKVYLCMFFQLVKTSESVFESRYCLQAGCI